MTAMVIGVNNAAKIIVVILFISEIGFFWCSGYIENIDLYSLCCDIIAINGIKMLKISTIIIVNLFSLGVEDTTW